MHLRHSLRKLELVLNDFGVFEVLAASFMPQLPQTTLETLRSNDVDDNENVKKTIGLISKTTPSHVHHTILYISFPFLHHYDVKMPNFAFYRGRKQATTKLYFSFRA